jgi:surface antigen
MMSDAGPPLRSGLDPAAQALVEEQLGRWDAAARLYAQAFRAAVMKTLDETPDGSTVTWQAPKTKFSSKITPQKTFADGKQTCREATIESDAHDRFQRGLYTFCKASNGEWQFKLPARKSK